MGCPTGTGDSIYLDVKSNLTQINQITDKALASATAGAAALTSMLKLIQPVLDQITLDSAGSLSNPFSIEARPVRPTNTDLKQPTLLYNPTINPVTFNKTAQVPANFDKAAPTLNLPTPPNPLAATPPTGVPVVPDRTFPATPDSTIPGLPALQLIVVPLLPSLTLPSFTEPAPGNLGNQDVGFFSWTDNIYTPLVQTDVVTQIKAILGGSTGIPTSIWEMIWSRARRQVTRTSQKARDEAIGFWASRGHFLPTGALLQKIHEADDIALDQVAKITQEQAIQDAEIYVKRLNEALVQGIALEREQIGLYNEQAKRKLEAARLTIEMAIQTAKVRIEVYNAQMTGWHIKAQGIELQLRIELGKLEPVKVQLEQQKLVGQLNLQLLEAYRAQLEGIKAKFQLFRDQIEAVRVQYESDRIKIQAFAELVHVYTAEVQAYEAQWRGYAEAVRGQALLTESYKNEVSAFAERVRAYSEGVSADVKVADVQIASEKLKLETQLNDIKRFDTLLNSEVQRVQALTRVFEADVRAWEGEGKIEEQRVMSDETRFKVLLANADTKARIALDNLRLKIESAKEMYTLQLNGLDAILRSVTQIAAASLSAAHFAEHVQTSYGNTVSCTTSYQGT